MPSVVGCLVACLFMLGGSQANALDKIRIALPTKTYFPTIIAETALRQKFFEKEGIDAELTVYKSGAEAFEAIAAGAADLTHGSPAIVAGGRKKGVDTKAVGGTALGYYGWHIIVPVDSPIKTLADLAGKKVGITSAGSASDIIAHWAMSEGKAEFTRVPLGGGGLVPNLLSKNVDAIVLYSPLSFPCAVGEAGPQHRRCRRADARASERRLDRAGQADQGEAGAGAEEHECVVRGRGVPAHA